MECLSLFDDRLEIGVSVVAPKNLLRLCLNYSLSLHFIPLQFPVCAIAGLNGSRDFITDQKKSYEERRNITVSYLNKLMELHAIPQRVFLCFPSCKDLYGKRTPNGEILKKILMYVRIFLKKQRYLYHQGFFWEKNDYFRVCYTAKKNLYQKH
ncbi:MAG: hypothetical protein Ct9H300mP18_12550 [Candidatus Neomarinimicrobiota bacterium]|nr:MAG: hypothetical protein Ct9H300mP18_12550 [Candidatus Neomarinimicrobiota bacterium]